MDIKEKRSTGVCKIGGVNASPCELPYEPGINCSKQELAKFGAAPSLGDVVQKPANFGGRKIRIQDEARSVPDKLFMTLPAQCLANIGCSAALPNNGSADWFSREFFPNDGGFTLIRDADRGDILGAAISLAEGLANNSKRDIPDFFSIMLDPSGLRIVLRKLAVAFCHKPSRRIEEQGRAAGGALVDP